MKLEKDEALNLVVELIHAGKIELPNQMRYSVGQPASDSDSVFTERARIQAKYLRALLEELTKEDEKSE